MDHAYVTFVRYVYTTKNLLLKRDSVIANNARAFVIWIGQSENEINFCDRLEVDWQKTLP